ncbi:MAG: tyrosine-type recombinase/integrase [Bacillota bacterium]
MPGHHIKKLGKYRFRIVVEAGINPETGNRKRIVRQIQGKKEDADNLLTQILTELNQGTYIEPSKITFGEWLDRWLYDYKKASLRQTTWESYEIMIRCHIKPALGMLPIQTLQSAQLQSFYNSKLKTHSTKTVSYIHMVIKQALNKARQLKPPIINFNAAEGTDPPRIKRTEVTPLSEEQVVKFLNAAKEDRLYMAYLLLISTGLRRGELLGLRWDNIDQAKSTLTVIQSLTRTNEGSFFTETKTKAGRRTVPIPSSTLKELKYHKVGQAEQKLAAASYNDNNLVFCENDGSPLEPDFFSKHFHVLLRKALIPQTREKLIKLRKDNKMNKEAVAKVLGITRKTYGNIEAGTKNPTKELEDRIATLFGVNVKDIFTEQNNQNRLHDLRHTYATMLLKAGEHPKVVQELLGHSQISMTLDTYSHLVPGLKEAAVAKLDAMFLNLGTRSAHNKKSGTDIDA